MACGLSFGIGNDKFFSQYGIYKGRLSHVWTSDNIDKTRFMHDAKVRIAKELLLYQISFVFLTFASRDRAVGSSSGS